MLAGIFLALYLVPDATPLRLFLFVSGTCFAIGNFLLIEKIKRAKPERASKRYRPQPYAIPAIGVLIVAWLLYFLMSKPK
jgi:hypothetical protein